MATGIRTPTTLPPAKRDGYDDTYEETRGRTEMTTGHDRVRQLYRKSPRLFSVSWELSQSQYADFDKWFQDVINGSAYEFDTQVLDKTEVLHWHTCRFNPPTYTAEINEWNKWVVSAKLWSKEPPFLTRAPGTDDLHGNLKGVTIARGMLMIPVVLHGYMTSTTIATGVFNRPLTGRAPVAKVVALGKIQVGTP